MAKAPAPLEHGVHGAPLAASHHHHHHHHHGGGGGGGGGGDAPPGEGGGGAEPLRGEETERAARLLEEALTTLRREEREYILDGLIERATVPERVALVHAAVERMPKRERVLLFEGAYEYVVLAQAQAQANDAAIRRVVVAGFAQMLTAQQEGVLGELMRAVPSHRRADALASLLDGTADTSEVAGALAHVIMHVSADARGKGFSRLAQYADLGVDERERLAGLLSLHRPGYATSGCQTELSWAEADAKHAAAARPPTRRRRRTWRRGRSAPSVAWPPTATRCRAHSSAGPPPRAAAVAAAAAAAAATTSCLRFTASSCSGSCARRRRRTARRRR